VALLFPPGVSLGAAPRRELADDLSWETEEWWRSRCSGLTTDPELRQVYEHLLLDRNRATGRRGDYVVREEAVGTNGSESTDMGS
jgi:hypothetical protein